MGDFQPNPANNALFAELGIEALQCDVRNETDVRLLIETAVLRGGGLDILVNNAGIGMVKQIPDVSEAEWDRCLDTNLKGAFLTSKHAIGPLRGAAAQSSTWPAMQACCPGLTIRFIPPAKPRSWHSPAAWRSRMPTTRFV